MRLFAWNVDANKDIPVSKDLIVSHTGIWLEGSRILWCLYVCGDAVIHGPRYVSPLDTIVTIWQEKVTDLSFAGKF